MADQKVSDLTKLSVKDLKKFLSTHNVDTSLCLEKQDLIREAQTLQARFDSPIKEMKAFDVRKAQKTHPTGDPSFAVMQFMPSAFNQEETDPFLMCDEFGPMESKGVAKSPDEFPVGWHPHRGMDVMTYMLEGKGRHADSLGNRETFDSPGLQWISVGSGVEHAEAGGTPAGQMEHGFQIWVNVPGSEKMKDPRYGTHSHEELPDIEVSTGVMCRLIAGPSPVKGNDGPYKATQPVQIINFRLERGSSFLHVLPDFADNAFLYVYKGEIVLAGRKVKAQHAIHLDATDPAVRGIHLQALKHTGGAAILFAGKKIGEPIAWRGPFVMNTQAEIRNTIMEYQRGEFPPKRVAWDYRKMSAFPETHPPRKYETDDAPTDCL